jgi:hypothetical protein
VANYRFRPKGAEGPCAHSGAPESNRCQTQGAALGYRLMALSAPEDVDFFEAPVDGFSIMECRHLLDSFSFFMIAVRNVALLDMPLPSRKNQ